MARKYGLEPVSKGKAIDTCGWRNYRRTQLLPEPGFAAIALKHQAGHPEERLPEEAPANAAGELVIDGGVRGLPARFPEKAAHVGVKERLPIVEARRSGKSMVHGPLIRMRELIYVEGVRVDPPGPVDDVIPEG